MCFFYLGTRRNPIGSWVGGQRQLLQPRYFAPPSIMMERYTKQEKAGQGTYGVVYKSWDNETNEFVALKVCRQIWRDFHHRSSSLSLNLGK